MSAAISFHAAIAYRTRRRLGTWSDMIAAYDGEDALARAGKLAAGRRWRIDTITVR